MVLRITCLFTFISFSCSVVQGQQVATYSQYMFNGLAINPAYAGSHDALSTTVLARFQNVGLRGAPNTQTFSAHSPLLNRRVGLGLMVIHDQLSVINQTGIHFSYAYRIPLGRNADNPGTISFGLQGGVSMYNAQYTELSLHSNSSANPNPGTDNAFSQDIRESRPNIGAGVFYSRENAYFGVSMPSMVNNAFDRGEGFQTVHQNIPLIITGGYVFSINNLMKFKPNFLFKTVDNRPIEFDLNANILFDEVLWAGLSYKSSKQGVLMTQLQLTDQLQFGYSYTITLGPIRTVELGSHEVMLNYRFWFNKKGIVSPRYF
ncbi:MAG: type IX secretion system membrane protein PorP/SprF [Cyclobacteriaceae bacterium]